jgi:CRISPR-associated protein Cmr1
MQQKDRQFNFWRTWRHNSGILFRVCAIPEVRAMSFERILPFPGLAALPKVTTNDWRTYDFRTITPVFGAGVEARRIDAITPIRGTTVRGHLRFWWRVTAGRRFDNLKELRAEEARIWGSASSPSSVQIDVKVTRKDTEEWKGREQLPRNYPSYALFPVLEDHEFQTNWQRLDFQLSLRAGLDSAMSEAEIAVWAWANFGGIGTRTRRGCGALFCKELAPPAIPDLGWLRDKLNGHPSGEGTRAWPRMKSDPLLGGTPSRPVEAWEKAIRVLADFRQLPETGRSGRLDNGKAVEFHRSHWPEADTLRAQSGRGARNHMTTTTVPNPRALPGFPRAEFGLPYQVKFKEGGDEVNDVWVLPENSGSNRIASPLIIKPLAFGDGNQAVPMVACLDIAPPSGVRVMRNNAPLIFSTKPKVRDSGFANYNDSPMSGRSPSGSALEAFLNFVRGQFK